MPHPVEGDIKQLLASRVPALNRLVLDAWNRWWNLPGRARMFRRTRACLMHNYMMNEARTVFMHDRGIHIIERQETLLFLVEKRLLFRLKLGDVYGVSSNIETQTAMAFTDPEVSLTLFDLPDVARVDICYVLNLLQTKIDRGWWLPAMERRCSRLYQIFPEPKEDHIPVMLPTRPRQPSSAGDVVRLPSKDADKKQSG